MAYLPDTTDYDNVLTGKKEPGDIQLTGAAGGMPRAAKPAGSAFAAAPTSAAPQTMPTRQAFKGTSLSDITGDLGRISSGFGEDVSRFYETAGPSDPFGQEDIETLHKAVYGGEEDALGEAEQLVSAAYEGPMGLETEPIAGYEAELAEARGVTDPLRRGYGLTEWEMQRMPGLTPGEARFEAERRVGEVMPTALGITQQARQQMADIGAAQTGAQEFAEQRAAEEAETRERARELVTGYETREMGELEARAAEENRRAQELADAWATFQETQDLQDLYGAVDPETQERLGQINLGVQARQQEAQAKYDEIMQDPKYFAIKDIPLARLGGERGRSMSKKGQEKVMVEIDGKEYWLRRLLRGTQVLPGKTIEESKALANLIDERQTLMERYFSPTTSRTQGILGAATRQQTGSERALENLPYFEETGGRGVYADVMPLYQEMLGLPPMLPQTEISQYLSRIEGPEATPTTVATEQEAAELGRIYDLLGRTGGFERREAVRPEIQLAPEAVQEFNEAELQRYQQMVDALQAAEQARRDAVMAQHRRYEKGKYGWLKALQFVPMISGITIPAYQSLRQHSGMTHAPEDIAPEAFGDVRLPPIAME